VAISNPSLASAERVAAGKIEAVPAPKRLTIMPTVVKPVKPSRGDMA